MKSPENTINFETVSLEDARAAGSPATYTPENSQALDAKYEALAPSIETQKDKARTEEILDTIVKNAETVKEKEVSQEVLLNSDTEASEKLTKEKMAVENDVKKFLGSSSEGMSSEKLKQAIYDKERSVEYSISNGVTITSGVGAIGVLLGLVAPATIGLTPSLAAVLPAALTSVISIGGVGIASSAILLGGAGIGIAVAGYGLYKLRGFLNKRGAEKARKGIIHKEVEELF